MLIIMKICKTESKDSKVQRVSFVAIAYATFAETDLTDPLQPRIQRIVIEDYQTPRNLIETMI